MERGEFNLVTGFFDKLIYMPCMEYNGFAPMISEKKADLIYLCFPNSPTGMAISKPALQEWVDYANKNDSIIFWDAAYEAEEGVPQGIYECEGAKKLVPLRCTAFQRMPDLQDFVLGTR